MTEASTTVLYVQEHLEQRQDQRTKRYVVILREWSAKLTDATTADSVVHATVLTIWSGISGAYKESDVEWDKDVLLPRKWKRWQSQRFAIDVFDQLVRGELKDESFEIFRLP